MGGLRRRRKGGFSLVELVAVIAVTAVLAGASAVFIARSMEAHRDQRRRARLVDVAEQAIRRIARDVRRSLPNSVRVAAGGAALEMLRVDEGIAYREEAGTNPGPVPHTTQSDRLEFGVAGDGQWHLLGRLRALPFAYGTPLPAGSRVAVYPTATAALYADAATGANPGVITPAATTITIADDVDEDQVQLSAPFRFALRSPSQRSYLVSGPISYLCDLGAETLSRYAGYAVAAAQPTDPSLAPLSAAASSAVTRQVGACRFRYQPGVIERAALLTVEIAVSEAGEEVRLLQQVHVENVP